MGKSIVGLLFVIYPRSCHPIRIVVLFWQKGGLKVDKYKLPGLDKLKMKLSRTQNAAKRDFDYQEYACDELFPPVFMCKYTIYGSIYDFLANCGFPSSNRDEFDKIPKDSLDEYVRRVTSFKSWDTMMEQSSTELFLRHCGLG